MSQIKKKSYVSPFIVERDEILQIVPLAAVTLADVAVAAAAGALTGIAAGLMKDEYNPIISAIRLEPIII
jgi:hypothetical protein